MVWGMRLCSKGGKTCMGICFHPLQEVASNLANPCDYGTAPVGQLPHILLYIQYTAYHQHQPLWLNGGRWGHSGRTQQGDVVRTPSSRESRMRYSQQNNDGTWELQVCVCRYIAYEMVIDNIHVL